ncbi:MAG: hypothetical protein NWF01_12295 [Candidatus Bathyarchaeota archaeon]|nr:hypothetical protein [Candidatus Bathyarchaeota archaeon]
MKRIIAVLAIIALLGVFIYPTMFTSNVYAQTSYPISTVGHTVEIMYSGHIAITDIIRFGSSSSSVNNTLPSTFTMALPVEFAQHLLKVRAFTNDLTLPVTQNVPIDGHSELYGFRIDLAGAEGDNFRIVFIFENSLISQNETTYTMSYPAYPIFTQDVGGFVSSEIELPSSITPTNMTIIKSDGQVNQTTYRVSSLAAFTNIPATAEFFLTSGSLQLSQVPTLTRKVTINPSGVLDIIDTYKIVNNSPESIATFQLGVPLSASNIIVKDGSGRELSFNNPSISGSYQRLNVSLPSPLVTGQSLSLTAQYNSQEVAESGSIYLVTAEVFPYFEYYVDLATVSFYLPTGAQILSPLVNEADEATLTNQGYQQILTITIQGVSFEDHSVPNDGIISYGVIPLVYAYNIIWSSFEATFVAFIGISIVVIIVILLRKRQASASERSMQKIAPEKKTGEHPTAGQKLHDKIDSLTDAYEEKTTITEEIKALNYRVQKNKIPRRQYKTQHQALEHRLENLNKRIENIKGILRNSGSDYATLMRQLDRADENLADSEADLTKLEGQKARGEISLDTYRESQSKYEKERDKAQGTINGILLRLREKMY